MTILTRWHRLREAVAEGRICLVRDAVNADRIDEIPDGRFDVVDFVRTIDQIGRCPRFVLGPRLLELMMTDQAMMSVSDMIDCNVLSLPFPACVIEFDSGSTRYSVLLSEAAPEQAADGVSWMALPIASYKDEDDEIAMAFPASIGIRITSAGAAPEDTTEGNQPRIPNMSWTGYVSSYHAANGPGEDYMAGSVQIAFHRSAIALLSAFLLTNTIGLDQEEVKTGPLNKARLSKGKAPIPGSYRHQAAELRDRRGDDEEVRRAQSGRGPPAPGPQATRRLRKREERAALANLPGPDRRLPAGRDETDDARNSRDKGGEALPSENLIEL